MFIIFCFSARPASLSETDSGMIAHLVAGILHPSYRSWEMGRQLAMLEQLDVIVRKSAHFAEYGILCFLLANTFPYKKKGLAAAAALSILYAVTDEIHQYFVPGRAAMLRDVCIDGAGALLTALILLFIRRRHTSGR